MLNKRNEKRTRKKVKKNTKTKQQTNAEIHTATKKRKTATETTPASRVSMEGR